MAGDPRSFTDWKRVEALLATLQPTGTRTLDSRELASVLRAEVRGQDHVIDAIAPIICKRWAMQARRRPIANLLFVGPSGTGKTQIAYNLAKALYGRVEALVQFDGGNLTTSAHLSQLVGAPAGTVGAQEGGALTRALISNRKRVVLFDELDKAHSSIQQVFLSALSDPGRIMEGSGREGAVAVLHDAVVIVATNRQHEALHELTLLTKDPAELDEQLRNHLVTSGVFLPEVIGRFDGIFVFNPLGPIAAADVTLVHASRLASDYGLTLGTISPEAILLVVRESVPLLPKSGARAVLRSLERYAGEALAGAQRAGHSRVDLVVNSSGTAIEALPAGGEDA